MASFYMVEGEPGEAKLKTAIIGVRDRWKTSMMFYFVFALSCLTIPVSFNFLSIAA